MTNALIKIIVGVQTGKYGTKNRAELLSSLYALHNKMTEGKKTMQELMDDPDEYAKLITKAAQGGSFMQDLKAEIWDATQQTGKNMIMESQLDEIAMRLFSKWRKIIILTDHAEIAKSLRGAIVAGLRENDLADSCGRNMTPIEKEVLAIMAELDDSQG